MRAWRKRNVAACVVMSACGLCAGVVPTTLEDFHVPGTQAGGVSAANFLSSTACAVCHGGYSAANEPTATWSGSLMGQAGRDPLFFAQMTTANQDANEAGYYCLRCHVPNSIITGHSSPSDGSALNAFDKEGVSCHLCHSMADPVYKPGTSPAADVGILNGLAGGAPGYYGNAMFVLDPTGTRRGPRSDAALMHTVTTSAFHRTGEFCGTCHDVGNVEVSRRPDGGYEYNTLNQASPTSDPHGQFPLERTYTEWKLSAFAAGGVDLGGRFGGARGGVMRTCQDCHMPTTSAKACAYGGVRADMARHEFAGAAAPVLDLIAAYTAGDPAVDQSALAAGRAAAVSMLGRSADVALWQAGSRLVVRVINQTGHKLPTGHIEGRRVWINVRFTDAQGQVVAERGRYDAAEAELTTTDTEVFEMHVGLSPAAAAVTGYPAGVTGHMALADVVEKDTRIPPRGYSNAAYEAWGSGAVGRAYADGQYWADVEYAVPVGVTGAEVAVYYQNTPREYIDMLRANNHTNTWGETLHALWTATGRGAPIRITGGTLALRPVGCNRADITGVGGTMEEPQPPDGQLTVDDVIVMVNLFSDGAGCPSAAGAACSPADVTDIGDTGAGPDGQLTVDDVIAFVNAFGEGCAG